MSTEIREQPTPTRTDDGDQERFAHIVHGRDKVTEAYVTGQPIVALCGKRWVPTRDPDRYPLCPECKQVLAALREAQGS